MASAIARSAVTLGRTVEAKNDAAADHDRPSAADAQTAAAPPAERLRLPGGSPPICQTGRMRVSAKSDYALRALLEIAGRDDGTPVSAEELGRLQDIPHGFLQAILADLRRAGIVMSVRGQSGGWRLGRDAAEVSVADIIRAVDGPLVSVYGLRPESVTYNESAEVLQLVWIAARANLREVFEHVTVQMLADGELPAEIMQLTKDDDAWRPH